MIDVVQTNPELWKLVRAYLTAKKVVIDEGYSYEVDWQSNVSICRLTEQVFLQEAAWVILSAGMRETVVRKKFPAVSKAFYEWESSESILTNEDWCRGRALSEFNHAAKINAIIKTARIIHDFGFRAVRELIESDATSFIAELPFMGPATTFHLAKNLGVPVAKPDRHLIRLAAEVGYDSPQELCADIASIVPDGIAVVDVVLWRFATLRKDYIDFFGTKRIEPTDREDCGFCWLD